jgi:hypothetical protein
MRPSVIRRVMASLVLAFVLMFTVLPTLVVSACSCTRPAPTQQEYFDEAAAVFSGIVVTKLPSRRATAEIAEYQIGMLVYSTEKGEPYGLTELWTSQQSTACGYDFNVGYRYRIHAWKASDGRHIASTCAPVELLSEIEDEMGSHLSLPDGGVARGHLAHSRSGVRRVGLGVQAAKPCLNTQTDAPLLGLHELGGDPARRTGCRLHVLPGATLSLRVVADNCEARAFRDH